MLNGLALCVRLSSGAATASVAKQKAAALDGPEDGLLDEHYELPEEQDEAIDPDTDTLAAVSELPDTLEAQEDWEAQDADEMELDAFVNEAVAGQIR